MSSLPVPSFQTSFQPIAPREAPVKTEGALPWMRRNLFGNSWSTLVTIVITAVLGYVLVRVLQWGLLNAVFAPDLARCDAARGSGACWGVLVEKHRLILFGRFPYEEQWRALVATMLLLALVVVSCVRAFWRPWLAALWLAVLPLYFVLMRGGIAGLKVVSTELWGGLPLTVMLTTFGILLAFPLAVLLALGRRSQLPAIRNLCVLYVETVRGVPLISVLFMASFMFPLFMPLGTVPDVLLRVLVGLALFEAAYIAETVRGGLQAIPKGQVEAAQTLGLSYWQTQRKIVLPQALAIVVPNIMNSFISIFKSTSLVAIVSMYELTGALVMALNTDPEWRIFRLEGYIFVTMIFFIFCFSMSRYSLWIEKQLERSKNR